jgi:hypothetical protein
MFHRELNFKIWAQGTYPAVHIKVSSEFAFMHNDFMSVHARDKQNDVVFGRYKCSGILLIVE